MFNDFAMKFTKGLWGASGESLATLGVLWATLGVLLGTLGASGGSFGRPWGLLGPPPGTFFVRFGTSGATKKFCGALFPDFE